MKMRESIDGGAMKNKRLYLGIDLGGTFIKGGAIDAEGNVLASDSLPTECSLGSQKVLDNIAALCTRLKQKISGVHTGDVAVGIGIPGMIDSEQGEVVYSNNLGWKHVKAAEEIERKIGVRPKLTNDANAAALGEAKFGASKNVSDSVFLTLGTGVGSGIVLGGRLYCGNRSAGAEIGHMILREDGAPCTCGRRGCFEAYASATALIRETIREIESDPHSLLGKIDPETVTGKTVFDFYEKDAGAKRVVDAYIKDLGEGITSIANIFRPEVILLGGGVCAQGDRLIVPLQKFLDDNVFGGKMGPKVTIRIATLGNSAGFMGAAALNM